MNGKQALQYFQLLKGEASSWEAQVNSLAKYIAPWRYNTKQTNVVVQGAQPDFNVYNEIYDSTGEESSFNLATSMMSWLHGGDWLKYDVPVGVKKTDELQKKLDELSETTLKILAASNYYVERYALMQDVPFGTFCQYREASGRDFTFRCVPSFVCAMGRDNVITTVFAPYVYTAQQAAEEFGIDRIPETVREKAKDPGKWHETAEYVHFVMPNPNKVEGSALQEQMPWWTGWIHVGTGVYVKDRFGMDTPGGAMDSPYLVGGFLPNSRRSPNAPYYHSLAFAALPDMRQLQHITKAVDGRIEMEYAPPVGIPSSMPGGTVGLRPYDHFRLGDDNQMPQPFELPSTGIQWALERAQQLRDSIDRKFMKHIFRMLDNIDPGKATATEIQARLGEKEDFLPVFELIMNKFLRDDCQWICIKVIEAGLWEVPQELIIPGAGVLVPRVEFSNKLTRLLKVVRAVASMKGLGEAAQMAQLTGDPSPLDEFDKAKIVKENYLAQNGIGDGLKPKFEVDRERADRANFAKEMAESQAMGQQQGQAA